MTRNNLADILASCLDSIEQGESTLEECLALYPEHRNELESLLGTAAAVRERADFTPRPGFRLASRRRLLTRLDPRQPVRPRQSVRQARRKARPVFSRGLALLWTTILVLAASLIGGGTVYASNQALPGDVLYPVKLSIEDARLFIADNTGDVSLATGFAQTRVEEMQALIESDREGDLYLAAELFSDRITIATQALAAVAQEDPERAAQLSSSVEHTLSIHSEVLTSQLEAVPEGAKPAIEHAILASNTGREVVRSLFGNELPGGGPPQEIPGPPATQPGGGPPERIPDAAETKPGGGPPQEIPGPPATQPGGPPEGMPTPPAGGKP